MLIIGDININNNSVEDFKQDYLNMLGENGLISYVNQTTCEEGGKGTGIDHIFGKSDVKELLFTRIIFNTCVIDRFPITLKIDISLNKYCDPEFKKYIDKRQHLHKIKGLYQGCKISTH